MAQAKNREVLDAGRPSIRLAREAGGRIGLGTDLMGALDEQLHELRLQAEVEGPLALLRAATSVNAELLGRDDLGRIDPGADGELLVLDDNPLRDPSVLWGGPDRRAVAGFSSLGSTAAVALPASPASVSPQYAIVCSSDVGVQTASTSSGTELAPN